MERHQLFLNLIDGETSIIPKLCKRWHQLFFTFELVTLISPIHMVTPIFRKHNNWFANIVIIYQIFFSIRYKCLNLKNDIKVFLIFRICDPFATNLHVVLVSTNYLSEILMPCKLKLYYWWPQLFLKFCSSVEFLIHYFLSLLVSEIHCPLFF